MTNRGLQDQFLHVFPDLYPQLKFRGIKQVREGALGPFGFLLRVSLGDQELVIDLECTTMNAYEADEISRLIQDLESLPRRDSAETLFPTIIAPSLSQDARQLCSDHHICYLLLDGNALLQTPRAYFYIEKPPRVVPDVEDEEESRILAGKAERLVRTLLLEPERRWTMRDLAAVSGTSLGLASTASSRFAEAGWVHKGRSGLTLRDGQALLDALSETYDLMRNSYRMYRTAQSAAGLLARLALNPDVDFATTLWTAASVYLPDVSLQGMVAIYADQPPDLTARHLGLGQEGETVVFVFQPYDEVVLAGKQVHQGLPLVNPLQLYLDLMCGDENEQKLAQRVRAELLAF